MLYEDGELVVDFQGYPPLQIAPTPTRLELGHGPVGAGGELQFLAGDLDEVRIWAGPRTSLQIRDYRATELGSSPDPLDYGPYLLGYFRLDESDDAVTVSDSNAGYHAISGGPEDAQYPEPHLGTLVGFSFDTSPWMTPGAF
jgi:hypothetical protein